MVHPWNEYKKKFSGCKRIIFLREVYDQLPIRASPYLVRMIPLVINEIKYSGCKREVYDQLLIRGYFKADI
jgi:hypothetical protein